jgi:hypothetical protein
LAVAELLMPCLCVNYPDSQVRFNSNKKPTDETLFNYTKLIDNNIYEISSLLTLEMNALSWRAITMTNVDFTILQGVPKKTKTIEITDNNLIVRI